jgi:hypothetical protein
MGMELASGYWEYPLWNMLVDANHPERKLEHVNVTNQSAVFEGQGGLPCAILMVNNLEKINEIKYMGHPYDLMFRQKIVAIYLLRNP